MNDTPETDFEEAHSQKIGDQWVNNDNTSKR
jgi:hypothetical protein